MSLGSFPVSWQDGRALFFPKKGSISDLKYYRPISLINTNAKVFIRILNAQSIVENDLIMKIDIDHAQQSCSSSIDLLLD